MPIPSEYQRASLDFERFMTDARDAADLATTHMAWSMVVGVLHTFRRRLSLEHAVEFANVLPPVVRAIFVADWVLQESPLPFASREVLTTEVQSLRAAHNFSPASAIASVATALRKHVDLQAFERVLAKLPLAAAEFWSAGPEVAHGGVAASHRSAVNLVA